MKYVCSDIMKKLIILWDKIFNRRDGLMMFNVTAGKFRVVYKDDEKSVWMPYRQARDMAAIYGGTVQHKFRSERRLECTSVQYA